MAGGWPEGPCEVQHGGSRKPVCVLARRRRLTSTLAVTRSTRLRLPSVPSPLAGSGGSGAQAFGDRPGAAAHAVTAAALRADARRRAERPVDVKGGCCSVVQTAAGAARCAAHYTPRCLRALCKLAWRISSSPCAAGLHDLPAEAAGGRRQPAGDGGPGAPQAGGCWVGTQVGGWVGGSEGEVGAGRQ